MTNRYRIVPVGLDSWGIEMLILTVDEQRTSYIESYSWTGRPHYKDVTEEVITEQWWPMGWAVYKDNNQFLVKQYYNKDGTLTCDQYRHLDYETTTVFTTKDECKKIIDDVFNTARLKREREEAIALRMKTVLPEEYP